MDELHRSGKGPPPCPWAMEGVKEIDRGPRHTVKALNAMGGSVCVELGDL